MATKCLLVISKDIGINRFDQNQIHLFKMFQHGGSIYALE